MPHIWRVALACTAFAALTGVAAGGPAKIVPAGEPRLLVLINNMGGSPGGSSPGGRGPGGFGPGGAAAVGGLLGVIGGATQPSYSQPQYSEPPSQYYSPYDPSQQTSPQQSPPPQQTYQPAQQAPPPVPVSPAPTPAPVAATPVADTPVADTPLAAAPVPDTANSALTQVMPSSAAATLDTTDAAEPSPAEILAIQNEAHQEFNEQYENYMKQYYLQKYREEKNQKTAAQLEKSVLKDLDNLLNLK